MSSLSTGQNAADAPAESRAGRQPEPEPTTDRGDRVREIAYFMWLDEGCPEGEEERHWTTAEAALESEAEQRKRIEGEPPGEPATASPAPPRARRAAAE